VVEVERRRVREQRQHEDQAHCQDVTTPRDRRGGDNQDS
jgi:hypothetical protein